jgi:hypothetical protein
MKRLFLILALGMTAFAQNQNNMNGGTGVTQIIAGTNISISPTSGLGSVTINATGNTGVTSVGLNVNGATAPCGAISLSGTNPVTTSGTINLVWTGVSGDILTFNASNCPQDSGTLLSSLAPASSLTPSGVGLGNVTNDTQTKAAIVPNTVPAAGAILLGNAGGTAYASVSTTGCTITSAGAVTCTPTAVGLSNVTNNAQTQAAIVPNTAPAAGAILLGNAGGTAYASVSTTGCTITSAGVVTCTPTAVGLSNVTNDAQTKAAIVPNTAPSAGQILAGNAGGTAYAAVTTSGCTISSAGVINCGTSAVTPNLYAADSGAVNAYVVTLSPAMSALTTGVIGCFKVSANNTSTTPTVNFNGLGAKTIVKFAGGPVGTADLTTAEPACVIYDGTNFLLLNPQSSTGTGKTVLANSPSFSGAFQAYNGISLVNNGVCAEFGTVDSSNSAAITATTLYSPTATGRFKISGSLIVTTAATTSSILGGTTGVVITYTDGTSSVAQSMTMSGVAQNGSLITISSGNTGNTTTTQTNLIPIYIFAKTGVAIQYAVGYTSVGLTAMVYQLHLIAESC